MSFPTVAVTASGQFLSFDKFIPMPGTLVGALFALWIPILTGEATRAHRAQFGEFTLETADSLCDRFKIGDRFYT